MSEQKPPPTLAEHLSFCYREMNGLGCYGAAQFFADALARDPALSTAAAARLAELDALHSVCEAHGGIGQRDALGHAERRTLRRALGIAPP